MAFNFNSPEYLSHHRTRKNRVSPVSRASPAHMNNPLGPVYTYTDSFVSADIIAVTKLYASTHIRICCVFDRPHVSESDLSSILKCSNRSRMR